MSSPHADTTDADKVSLLLGVPVDSGSVVRTRAHQRIGLTPRRRKMSRRANLIAFCGVSSLCILLLIVTAQHRPLPASLAASNAGNAGGIVASGLTGGGGGGGGGGGPLPGSAVGTSSASAGHGGGERHMAGYNSQQQPQTAPIIYNLTASAADVLAAQRAKIYAEMENFEYPSRFGVDGEKLSDLTPETDGTPPRSLIVTTWRSGSTFLGDILNAMPGNYYHYEPLLNFGIKQVRDDADGVQAVHNLKKLLKCDYSDIGDYLEYGKTHTYLFEHNERLWSVCKEFPHYCWRAKFLTPFCKLFPIQSMKTVRLRLSLAEQLLEDDSLNVRIILLVRDPRGTMQSRKHRVWCAGNPDCDEPRFVCEDLIADYESAEKLLKKYPSRFRTLRYEDLSLNPYEMTQDVLQFYGLPFDPMVEEFLDTHTKVNIGGVSSTYRDSRSAPFHWKQDLKIDEIKHIQNYCTKAMELWGYRVIRNFTDFQRTFDPIVLPPPFT